MGLVSGVAGLVREPVRGARAGGLTGLAKGVGRGIAGTAIRPTMGVIQFIGRAAASVETLSGAGEAAETHSIRVGRTRLPRMLSGPDGHEALRPYQVSDALAKHVLRTASEGKYAQEQLLFCD